jgi:hypothetical protein
VTVSQAPARPAPPTTAQRIIDLVRRYVSLALVGTLLVVFLPVVLRPGAALVRARPLPAVASGVLGVAGFVALLIALVVATVLLAVAFGGLTLGGLAGATVVTGMLAAGVAGLAFTLAAVFVAPALVGLLLGQLVFERTGAPALTERWRPVVAVLVGVLLLVVLTAIPVIGPVLNLLAVLLGLGGLTLVAWERWSRRAAGTAGERPVSAAEPPQIRPDGIPIGPAV